MSLNLVLFLMGLAVVVGIPIAWCILIPSFIYLLTNGIPLSSGIGRMSGALNSFTLMAVPFFLLAGSLMNSGGLTAKLIEFTKTLVGHLRGGLAQVNVAGNMIFAGMSGSAVADAGGLGSVLIKPMKRDGYEGPYAAALTAAAATLGPLIPPSIPMVIYGVIAEESVGRLFLGGATPGILLGLLLMVMVRFMPQTKLAKVYPRAKWVDFKRTAPTGFLALMMPVVVLAGITIGFFTPTEAAAVAVVYAAVVSGVFLRSYTRDSLKQALVESMLVTANVFLIVAASAIFGWILAREGATSSLGAWIEQMNLSPTTLLVMVSALLLFLGCFLEGISILIVLTPVLLPIVQNAGIDPVYFGVLMVYLVNIGLITPPMGLVLFVVCDISGERFDETSRAIAIFYLPMLVMLIAMIAYPPIITWLPDLILNK